MLRLLAIPVAVVALAVTTVPAPASAGLLSSPLGISASSGAYLGKQLAGKAKITDGRFP